MDSTPSAPVIIEEVAPTTSQGKKRARTESFLGSPEPRKISRTEETALPDLFVGHLGLPAGWENPEPWAGNDQTYRATVEDEMEHRLEEDQQWHGEHGGYQGQGAGETAGGHTEGVGGKENRMEHGPGEDGHGARDQGGMEVAHGPDSGEGDLEGDEHGAVEWVPGDWFGPNWYACYAFEDEADFNNEVDNDNNDQDDGTESETETDSGSDDEPTPTPIHLMDNSGLTDAQIVQATTILYRLEVIEKNADLAGLMVGKKEMKAKVKLYLLPKIVEHLRRPDINVSE